MLVLNADTGASMVQDNTITSAKIADNTIVVGDVLTSAGIGYKTGDGGSVTQLTSKSTAVTLDKPCGKITINNAALAANTHVLFVLNNTFIGAEDVVCVYVKSGFATAGTYQTWVEGGAAGNIQIAIRNISAGSLSEAVVINFAIIKAVGA